MYTCFFLFCVDHIDKFTGIQITTQCIQLDNVDNKNSQVFTLQSNGNAFKLTISTTIKV